MTRSLEKDFLVGAVLPDAVRQHPEIRLNPDFIDEVLTLSDDICRLFNLETDLPKNIHPVTYY